MENRLKAKYENEVRPSLIEKFNYSSVMAAPKIDKIVLNMGVGEELGRSCRRIRSDLRSKAINYEGKEVYRRLPSA